MVYAALSWTGSWYGVRAYSFHNATGKAERIPNMFFAYACTPFSFPLFSLLSPSGVSTRIQVASLPIKITASKLEPPHRNSNREEKDEPAANEHAGTPETLCQKRRSLSMTYNGDLRA